MADSLPQDREKALEAIANGWGRSATAAHPLCRCGQRIEYPRFLPPCELCGAERDEKCRQPGEVCGKTSEGRSRRRIKAHLKAQGCPVHEATS